MEEIKDRKAFNFYRSYWEVAQMLNNKNRLAFFDALLSRQFTGEEPTFNGSEQANFAWVSQKHSIDSQIDGWINKKIAISKQGSTTSLPPTEPPLIPPALPPSVQEKEKEKEKGKEEEEVKEKEEVEDKLFPNEEVTKPLKRFVPPTIKEIDSYIKEKGYNVNAEKFFYFYESKGWKVGKNKMISWRASVATWNTKDEKSSAYKKKEEQETPSVAPALTDGERLNKLIRRHPILDHPNNMISEADFRSLRLSYDEAVSFLPNILKIENRKCLYLELMDERDRRAYYAKKELESKQLNQLNKVI